MVLDSRVSLPMFRSRTVVFSFLGLFWLLPAWGSSDAGSREGEVGSPEATVPAAVLKLSTAALDSALRKDIDPLPRRVNDQFNNPGDMVNFVIVGSEMTLRAAFDAANWHVA